MARVALHYYCSSSEVQQLLEEHIEKKAGRNYAPPGNDKLVFFVDDYSLPAVDDCGTQPPVAFLRQHLDYGQWCACVGDKRSPWLGLAKRSPQDKAR